MTEPRTYPVAGNLTFETAPGLLEQSRAWLSGESPKVVLDLSAAGRTDSAGIALMLEWIELARARNLELGIINLPDQTREFIEANGLEKLFRQYAS